MAKLEKIEGVGKVQAKKMAKAGVITLEGLLKAGAAAKGRKALAKETGISVKLILKWVNRADLARIKGVGEEYGDLLEVSGVDTVPELARRKPENLCKKMEEVNGKKKVVRKLPTLTQVTDWVGQAKKMDKVITH